MGDSLILTDIRDGYAIVTLNRPDKRNALSRAAQAELRDALDEIRDKGSKAVVITGAGDVSFCSGADTREGAPTQRRPASAPDSWLYTQHLITDHPAVFIAAVNGFALGGGLTLVHNCDLAVAADTATFGAPEITFGIFPALAGPSTAKRILPKHAAELIFTGKRVDAATALRFGLVNQVVPAAELLTTAVQLAEHIAQFDATALDYSKQGYRTSADLPWHQALDYGVRSTAVISAQRAIGTT
ncbi:enoyl-CoA hydratase/isomerase family protein [Streptomyces fuscichromogenes]|uniref:Enoyl-CoA hydratase n=1 Tax=Streptomyces fuscichromogenes TaxID=1324013 RepID=A0A917XPZ8_9ACTN|nr:enoyl-CoA hydratase/isomerase family protein [Streptomyces fuscichromogenes]GGN46227.1 enoyl-CoA hydratase [Streptomyces fuscichromogenes]